MTRIDPTAIPAGTRRISSAATFFHKRVFPAIWFGFVGVWVIDAAYIILIKDHFGAPMLVVSFLLMVALFMCALGYLIMSRLIFGVMDEAWDGGDAIIVRNRGQTERIPLTDIVHVTYPGQIRPSRATLILKQPCRFGNEVSFFPPREGLLALVYPGESTVIVDLIRRVGAARHPA